MENGQVLNVGTPPDSPAPIIEVRDRGSLDMNVLVLLSGGIDSTACVSYYTNLGYSVKGIFIDYGQAAAVKEFESAAKVSGHYSIELDRHSCSLGHDFSVGEIPGRNAFLVLCAIMAYPGFKGILSMGIHSGVPYYDCTEAFVADMNKILVGYRAGQVVLDTPFLKWSKGMIFTYCTENKVPISLTYSCEEGFEKPCGKCRSCLDRSVFDETP